MSGLLAGKVWQSNLDGTLKPLAACLADIANDDGTSIYPSVEYICWLMNKSPRAIQYQIKALLEKGILEIVSEASGRPGDFNEFQMNESKLPRRKSWKEFKRRAKIADAKKDETGAISAETGANPDISPYYDPSSEPSIPVPQVKPKLPRAADPFAEARSDLITFLVAEIGELPSYPREVKAINWLLEQEYSADQCRRCWRYLDSQEWRDSAITWQTVKKEIGGWKHRGEPATAEARNGSGKLSRAEIGLAGVNELLEEARNGR